MSFLDDANTTFHKVRNMYLTESARIKADPTLSDIGKEQAMGALLNRLRAQWRGVVADYNLRATLADEELNHHMILKPKPVESAEDVMSEERTFKRLLARFALSDSLPSFLGVLSDIQKNGTDAEKTALVVNYAQIVSMAKGIIPQPIDSKEPVGPNAPKEADYLATKAQLTEKLQTVYRTISEGMKSEKQIKWEARLNELKDNKDTIKSEFEIAQRIFKSNFEYQFGAGLEPAQNSLNIWK